MKKKLYFNLIFLFILILIFTSAVSAYYQPQEYKKSLLKLRDAERSIRSLQKNVNEAEKEFRIIELSEIKSEIKNIEKNYQKLIMAYQNNEEQRLNSLVSQIIKDSSNLNLRLIESKPVQLRGLWLDSGTFAETGGREGLQELLDLIEKANFNVIFPEVYYKGLSVIPSNHLFKQDPEFSGWEEDPLKVLIEEAEKRNIEIHPWIWVFNENTAGQPGRILKKHPDWANKNREGEIVSYHNSTWLSPSREDVKNYLQKRYKYLVENYNLDGINLDYIRFPEEYRGSFGYDQSTVDKFENKYGLDPFEISSDDSKASLWNQYRENLITQMVKETSQMLREVDSDLLISADVIPGTEEARYRALQNWALWLKKDYLDFVLPMTYTENLFSELKRWVQNDRQKIDKPLYAGVSVFKLSSEQMLAQINQLNQINPNGMSLFAAAHLKKDDYQSLSEGIFNEPAYLPHKNKKIALVKTQNFILKRLNVIKREGKINTHQLIRIRVFLEKKVNLQTDQNFNQFINEENLDLKNNVKRVLQADFNYLSDIINFY